MSDQKQSQNKNIILSIGNTNFLYTSEGTKWNKDLWSKNFETCFTTGNYKPKSEHN